MIGLIIFSAKSRLKQYNKSNGRQLALLHVIILSMVQRFPYLSANDFINIYDAQGFAIRAVSRPFKELAAIGFVTCHRTGTSPKAAQLHTITAEGAEFLIRMAKPIKFQANRKKYHKKAKIL